LPALACLGFQDNDLGISILVVWNVFAPGTMNTLHAPTVPSGPTTAPTANGNATQLTIAELQRKKDMVEGELKALGGVLDSVCATP
jgi:hypothetical protein